MESWHWGEAAAAAPGAPAVSGAALASSATARCEGRPSQGIPAERGRVPLGTVSSACAGRTPTLGLSAPKRRWQFAGPARFEPQPAFMRNAKAFLPVLLKTFIFFPLREINKSLPITVITLGFKFS